MPIRARLAVVPRRSCVLLRAGCSGERASPRGPSSRAARDPVAGAALVIYVRPIVVADITTPTRLAHVMAIYEGVFVFAVRHRSWPGGLLAERFGLHAPFVVYAVTGVVVCARVAPRPDTRGFGTPADVPAGDPRLPPFAARSTSSGRLGFVLVSLVGFVNAVARRSRSSTRPPGCPPHGPAASAVDLALAIRPGCSSTAMAEDGDSPGDGDGGRLPRPLRPRPVLRRVPRRRRGVERGRRCERGCARDLCRRRARRDERGGDERRPYAVGPRYVIGPIALGAAAICSARTPRSGSPRCCSSWWRSCSGAWRRSYRPGRI